MPRKRPRPSISAPSAETDTEFASSGATNGEQHGSSNGHSPAAALLTMATGQESNPLDPLGLVGTFTEVWSKVLEYPAKLVEAQMSLVSSGFELWQQSLNKMLGLPSSPVATPPNHDERFENESWSTNVAFDFVKQAYLLTSEAMLKLLDETEGLDAKTHQRARFFTKQFIDEMSPSNFAMTNPEVIDETIRSGGQNLVKGMEHIVEDLKDNNGMPALVDKKAFKVGENVATTPGKVVYRNNLCELIQYTPTTPRVHERPLFIIPPWINKYYILDLRPDNSFVKYAVDQGYTVFMISWKNPGPELAETTLDDYMQLGPITCARVAAEIAGTDDVNAVGYCLGGTALAMLLAYQKRKGERLVNAATFFTALVDFSEPGEIGAFLSDEGVQFLDDKMRKRGYLDASDMAMSFNMLRSNDLIWSVAVNRYLMGKEPPQFDLLFWNCDSTRMPYAMHSYYLRNMYVENNLVKPGGISLLGEPLDLRAVDNDVYSVATADDHIALWRAVYKMTQLFSGKTTFRVGHSGHIAGIISPPGKKRSHYWSNETNPADPDRWFKESERHEGSWWGDWQKWLAARSGAEVEARVPGALPAETALADAPGTYVLEK